MESEDEEDALQIQCQEQEDELVALSSIYDERVFKRLQSGGEVSIHLELPENFEVRISTSKEIEKTADEDVDHTNDVPWDVFPVKYLPPVVLNFVFPSDYPSIQPPQYTLLCKWLNVLQVNNLMLNIETSKNTYF